MYYYYEWQNSWRCSPSRRTTRGNCRLMDLQALVMPLAMVAQLTMPPKMFTRMAFTCSTTLQRKSSSPPRTGGEVMHINSFTHQDAFHPSHKPFKVSHHHQGHNKKKGDACKFIHTPGCISPVPQTLQVRSSPPRTREKVRHINSFTRHTNLNRSDWEN